MSEIRSWAAGALAVMTLATGVGAATLLTRAPQATPGPVVAVAVDEAATRPGPPLAAPPTSATIPTTSHTTTPATSTTATTTVSRSSPRRAVYRCAPQEAARFDDPARPNVITNHDCPDIERSRSRAQQSQRSAADEGPLIFGETNAQAYRRCVASPNSPGASECRRITDGGGRGE